MQVQCLCIALNCMKLFIKHTRLYPSMTSQQGDARGCCSASYKGVFFPRWNTICLSYMDKRIHVAASSLSSAAGEGKCAEITPDSLIKPRTLRLIWAMKAYHGQWASSSARWTILARPAILNLLKERKEYPFTPKIIMKDGSCAWCFAERWVNIKPSSFLKLVPKS